jgi:hypothetical protein
MKEEDAMLPTIYNVLATTALAWSIVVVARPHHRSAKVRGERRDPLPPGPVRSTMKRLTLHDARRLGETALQLYRRGAAADRVGAIGRAMREMAIVDDLPGAERGTPSRT